MMMRSGRTGSVDLDPKHIGLMKKLAAGHVLRASKRVFGIPDFRLCALTDGIRQFLYSRSRDRRSS
jgi:hypothetical protein